MKILVFLLLAGTAFGGQNERRGVPSAVCLHLLAALKDSDIENLYAATQYLAPNDADRSRALVNTALSHLKSTGAPKETVQATLATTLARLLLHHESNPEASARAAEIVLEGAQTVDQLREFNVQTRRAEGWLEPELLTPFLDRFQNRRVAEKAAETARLERFAVREKQRLALIAEAERKRILAKYHELKWYPAERVGLPAVPPMSLDRFLTDRNVTNAHCAARTNSLRLELAALLDISRSGKRLIAAETLQVQAITARENEQNTINADAVSVTLDENFEPVFHVHEFKVDPWDDYAIVQLRFVVERILEKKPGARFGEIEVVSPDTCPLRSEPSYFWLEGSRREVHYRTIPVPRFAIDNQRRLIP